MCSLFVVAGGLWFIFWIFVVVCWWGGDAKLLNQSSCFGFIVVYNLLIFLFFTLFALFLLLLFSIVKNV